MHNSVSNLGKFIPYLFLLFTIGFGWFILAPLVPDIIHTFGVHLEGAILLISLYGYTMVIVGLFAGYISARFTVKTALYSAAIISIVGLVGRALAYNYMSFFMFSIVAAVAYPLAMAPVGSISESLFKKRSHTIIGMSVGVLFLGMAIGAFLGPGISTIIGFSGTLGVTAVLAIFAGIWVALGVKGYPTFYKGKSLKGAFKLGMIKNWYVGLAIASMSVMFGSIASIMLIGHGISISRALTYGGLLGGLAFLGSAFGALILPPIFEKYKRVKVGLISTSLLSLIFVSLIAYFLSYKPILSVLIGAFFLFGFFGNAYWSMALASTTNYVGDPAKAGFATSMYSVLTNLGVAFIPMFLGPAFYVEKTVGMAVVIVVVIEFIAFLLSFTLKTKNTTQQLASG